MRGVRQNLDTPFVRLADHDQRSQGAEEPLDSRRVGAGASRRRSFTRERSAHGRIQVDTGPATGQTIGRCIYTRRAQSHRRERLSHKLTVRLEEADEAVSVFGLSSTGGESLTIRLSQKKKKVTFVFRLMFRAAQRNYFTFTARGDVPISHEPRSHFSFRWFAPGSKCDKYLFWG